MAARVQVARTLAAEGTDTAAADQAEDTLAKAFTLGEALAVVESFRSAVGSGYLLGQMQDGALDMLLVGPAGAVARPAVPPGVFVVDLAGLDPSGPPQASALDLLAQACLEGDFETARRLHARYLPLMNVNFVESNPIPVKAAMALMGLLDPVWRLPMCPPGKENLAKIEAVVEAAGLLRKVPVAG